MTQPFNGPPYIMLLDTNIKLEPRLYASFGLQARRTISMDRATTTATITTTVAWVCCRGHYFCSPYLQIPSYLCYVRIATVPSSNYVYMLVFAFRANQEYLLF
jgi:hypothetical protein